MKKYVILVLAGIMAINISACGTGNNGSSEAYVESTAVATTQTVKAPETTLELLNKVWGSYSDDEKFPVAGGDMSEENNNMEGPGKYNTDDAEAIETNFGVPVALVPKIDEASSMMHMMNANTFTCGAFKVKDEKDATEIMSETYDKLVARQWICGSPDRLYIYTYEKYVVVVFGEKELVEVFNNRMLNCYPDAGIGGEVTFGIE